MNGFSLGASASSFLAGPGAGAKTLGGFGCGLGGTSTYGFPWEGA